MFPLRRNAIPPNIFFSFSPLRFPRERRIRPASVSSNAIGFDWVWVRWELGAPPNGFALKLRATRPPAQGKWTTVRARQGTNTPVPLERSPPASFKRLLGSDQRHTSTYDAPSSDHKPDELRRFAWRTDATSAARVWIPSA